MRAKSPRAGFFAQLRAPSAIPDMGPILQPQVQKPRQWKRPEAMGFSWAGGQIAGAAGGGNGGQSGADGGDDRYSGADQFGYGAAYKIRDPDVAGAIYGDAEGSSMEPP